jgi:hypothetical protein
MRRGDSRRRKGRGRANRKAGERRERGGYNTEYTLRYVYCVANEVSRGPHLQHAGRFFQRRTAEFGACWTPNRPRSFERFSRSCHLVYCMSTWSCVSTSFCPFLPLFRSGLPQRSSPNRKATSPAPKGIHIGVSHLSGTNSLFADRATAWESGWEGTDQKGDVERRFLRHARSCLPPPASTESSLGGGAGSSCPPQKSLTSTGAIRVASLHDCNKTVRSPSPAPSPNPLFVPLASARCRLSRMAWPSLDVRTMRHLSFCTV